MLHQLHILDATSCGKPRCLINVVLEVCHDAKVAAHCFFRALFCTFRTDYSGKNYACISS
jgi:hypothetical protein